jgi:hypothetical protein
MKNYKQTTESEIMRGPVLTVFIGLVLCAAPARAEWALAGEEGFSKIYFDPASRRQNPDGSISLRALTDYDPASPEAVTFKLSEKGLSEIEQVLFDCARNAYRSEGGVWYDGHMATGATRRAYSGKAAWGKVPSFYAALFAKACASASQ